MSQEHMRKAQQPDMVVPLVDEQRAGRIYDKWIHRAALVGALIGAILLGLIGWAVAEGPWPIAGLGQFAASGAGVAVFTSATVGAAAGGLAGSLIALFRLPRR